MSKIGVANNSIKLPDQFRCGDGQGNSIVVLESRLNGCQQFRGNRKLTFMSLKINAPTEIVAHQ
jgi:hypothetical protein